MNIWASARTMKPKRIPRQRNDFIQEQNLHSWTGDLGFSFLTGPVCEPLQGELLWAVSHHGHALPYMRKSKCQTTPQCCHVLFTLKSISSGQNHALECLLKSFIFFFWRNSVYRWPWCCISVAEKVRSKKVAFLWNKRSVNALFPEQFIPTSLDQLLEVTFPTTDLSEGSPSY